MASGEPIYGAASEQYWEAGWRGILPFAPKTKWPPPEGRTGRAGQDPSFGDVYDWAHNGYERHNIGLRLPADVVGIDVDAYGDRTGAATLIEAEKRWGALPHTVRSTSRGDGVSGIRLYRKPADVELRDRIKFPEKNIGHIEIVQTHHRYVMCWPSVHPEGGTYRWLDEACAEVDLPVPRDLPELPAGWVEALRVDPAEITATADVEQVLKSLPTGSMSVQVERVLNQAIDALEEADSRHESTRTNVGRLLRLADNYEPGVAEALAELRAAFVESVGNDRPGAAGEFDRMLRGQRIHDLIASTPDASLERLAGAERKPEPPTPPTTTADAGDDYELQPMTAADRFLMAGEIDESEYEQPEENPDLYTLRSVADLARIVPAEPLIDGLLYQNTLVQISGNPGSYKTFLVLSMACAVASRKEMRSWAGYPVKAHGKVIYIAAEGLSGLRARILAWCEENEHDASELDLLLLDRPVQLGSRKEMEKLVRTVVRHSAVMVVFDTRSRCSIGLDENKAQDMVAAIDLAEDLRAATDATVVMIHHSSRSGTAGRGSNTWDGAVWSDLRVHSQGNVATLHCEKHKDVPSGCDHEFEVVRKSVSPQVMPGVNPFMRNTLVVRGHSQGRENDLAGAEDQILNLILTYGEEGLGISIVKLLEILDNSGIEHPAQATVYRHANTLVRKGKLLSNKVSRTVYYRAPEGREPETD